MAAPIFAPFIAPSPPASRITGSGLALFHVFSSRIAATMPDGRPEISAVEAALGALDGEPLQDAALGRAREAAARRALESAFSAAVARAGGGDGDERVRRALGEVDGDVLAAVGVVLHRLLDGHAGGERGDRAGRRGEGRDGDAEVAPRRRPPAAPPVSIPAATPTAMPATSATVSVIASISSRWRLDVLLAVADPALEPLARRDRPPCRRRPVPCSSAYGLVRGLGLLGRGGQDALLLAENDRPGAAGALAELPLLAALEVLELLLERRVAGLEQDRGVGLVTAREVALEIVVELVAASPCRGA